MSADQTGFIPLASGFPIRHRLMVHRFRGILTGLGRGCSREGNGHGEIFRGTQGKVISTGSWEQDNHTLIGLARKSSLYARPETGLKEREPGRESHGLSRDGDEHEAGSDLEMQSQSMIVYIR